MCGSGVEWRGRAPPPGRATEAVMTSEITTAEIAVAALMISCYGN